MKIGTTLSHVFRPIAWALDKALGTEYGNCGACKKLAMELDALDGKSHKLKHAWLSVRERIGYGK